MKKLTSLVAAILLCSQFVQAQSIQPLQKLVKLHLLGVSFEKPVGLTSVVHLKAGIGGAYDINVSDFAYRLGNNQLSAQGLVEVRRIYNRHKLQSRGTSLDYNAGNFVAFQSKLAVGISSPTIHSLNEVHWGLQRKALTRLVINPHIGLGLATDFSQLTFYPAVAFRVAYILSAK